MLVITALTERLKEVIHKKHQAQCSNLVHRKNAMHMTAIIILLTFVEHFPCARYFVLSALYVSF